VLRCWASKIGLQSAFFRQVQAVFTKGRKVVISNFFENSDSVCSICNCTTGSNLCNIFAFLIYLTQNNTVSVFEKNLWGVILLICNVIQKHVMKFNDLAEVRCSRHYVTCSWSQSLYEMLSLFSNTVILQLCFFIFVLASDVSACKTDCY